MALHVHTSGEQVHTVPGGTEDDRLHADPTWRLDQPPADEAADTATTDTGDGDGEESP